MRILLQHVRTQLYLQSLGIWTANALEALEFPHAQRAIEFARDHALQGVQIAIMLGERGPDEVFPLPVREPEAAPRATAR